jgi:hypothetical protein
VIDEVLPRGPGSLVLRPDSGTAGCLKCQWAGVPNRTASGDIDRRCPSCEIAAATDAEYAAAAAPAVKLGRNDPCYCGSGKKFKKCHGA